MTKIPLHWAVVDFHFFAERNHTLNKDPPNNKYLEHLAGFKTQLRQDLLVPLLRNFHQHLVLSFVAAYQLIYLALTKLSTLLHRARVLDEVFVGFFQVCPVRVCIHACILAQ